MTNDAYEQLAHGGAAGIMKPHPALHRVIPAQSALKSKWILPYDDVRAVLLAAKTFRVTDCICRVQRALLGHRCSFPPGMCLGFSLSENPSPPGNLSQAEALTLLDRSEEIGLVHTVSNVMKGIGYVCNCCCGIFRGINDWGIDYAVIDPETSLRLLRRSVPGACHLPAGRHVSR